VISADRTRLLSPGEAEHGWLARRGHVPLGYLGDVTDGQLISEAKSPTGKAGYSWAASEAGAT
jgi:hypothetical protein